MMGNDDENDAAGTTSKMIKPNKINGEMDVVLVPGATISLVQRFPLKSIRAAAEALASAVLAKGKSRRRV